mgnify:CR=1 FL=1
MGALLRVQIMLTDDVIKTIHDLQALGMKVYASTPSAEALSITKADFSSGAVCDRERGERRFKRGPVVL